MDVVICNSDSGKAEWWKEISFGESISRGLLKLIVFSVHQILKLISLRRRKRQERQQISAQNRICRYLSGRSRQKRKILVTVLHTFMEVYVELKKETALFINFSYY